MQVEVDQVASLKAAGKETLLQSIGHTYQEVWATFERYMGMSRARWVTLSLLWREGTVSQARLAQRLRIDGAAVTRQVQQLEQEGLVTRRADPEDNRFMLVTLTPEGRRMVDELWSKRDRFEAIVTEGISAEEIGIMGRCLRRIRDNLQSSPEIA
jgi:DNA-binding MarR family transcriptional regulator